MKSFERGTRGIVAVRGSIMHVRRQPDEIVDGIVADEAEEICKLEFTPRRRAIVAVGDRIRTAPVGVIVPDDKSDRHVAGDHLPDRARGCKFPLQPIRLPPPEQHAAVLALVGTAIGAQVDEEYIEQRAVADLAEDATGLCRRRADRRHFMKSPGGLPA